MRSYLSPVAASQAEKAKRAAHAAELVGERVVGVRYFEFDLLHAEEGSKGPREATESEWTDPPWQLDDCDEIDFGLDLETASGRVFKATWQTGSEFGLSYEGLVFCEQPYDDSYEVVWSVADHSRWASVLSKTITGVELCWYGIGRRHWWSAPKSVLCCHAAVLHFGDSPVYITLGLDRGPPHVTSVTDVSVIFETEVAQRCDMGPYWEQNVT